jgi:hypothetical protein
MGPIYHQSVQTSMLEASPGTQDGPGVKQAVTNECDLRLTNIAKDGARLEFTATGPSDVYLFALCGCL